MLIISNSIPREFAFRPWDRRCDGRAVYGRAARVAPFSRGFSEAKTRANAAPPCQRVPARRRARQDRNPNPSRLHAGNHVINPSGLNITARPGSTFRATSSAETRVADPGHGKATCRVMDPD